MRSCTWPSRAPTTMLAAVAARQLITGCGPDRLCRAGGDGVTYVVSKLAGACAAKAVLADSHSAKSAAESGLL